jgi:hypothetical protein
VNAATARYELARCGFDWGVYDSQIRRFVPETVRTGRAEARSELGKVRLAHELGRTPRVPRGRTR